MKWLMVLVYMLVLVGLRLIRDGVGGDQVWVIGILVIGFGLGWLIPGLDSLIYVYTYPEELTSIRVMELIRSRRWGQALKVLRDTKGERKRLILHSFVFQAVFWIFGFWVMTSSGNFFGRGIVLGAMLNFLLWNWEKYKMADLEPLFWQIKREIEPREIKSILGAMAIALGYLTLVGV